MESYKHRSSLNSQYLFALNIKAKETYKKSQQACTCSKPTAETLEQRLKYVPS